MNFNFIFQVQPYLKYYVGRKHMFDNNYKEAEEYLSNDIFVTSQDAFSGRRKNNEQPKLSELILSLQ